MRHVADALHVRLAGQDPNVPDKDLLQGQLLRLPPTAADTEFDPVGPAGRQVFDFGLERSLGRGTRHRPAEAADRPVVLQHPPLNIPACPAASVNPRATLAALVPLQNLSLDQPVFNVQ